MPLCFLKIKSKDVDLGMWRGSGNSWGKGNPNQNILLKNLF